MKTISNLVLYFLLLLFLHACSPANILATGGGSAMVIAEGERSMGSVVDDATIKRVQTIRTVQIIQTVQSTQKVGMAQMVQIVQTIRTIRTIQNKSNRLSYEF